MNKPYLLNLKPKEQGKRPQPVDLVICNNAHLKAVTEFFLTKLHLFGRHYIGRDHVIVICSDSS